MAIHFLKKGISPEDKEAVAKACIDADVSIVYENGVQQVYLNGENITGMLRTEEVGNMASKTSAIPAVREKLLELQKTLAREKDVIMDGRDIGTNILPNARCENLSDCQRKKQEQNVDMMSLRQKGNHVTLTRLHGISRKEMNVT